MNKLLYDEATAYRTTLFVLIAMLMPKPAEGSLDALLQKMTESEKRDWPAQRVIDMATAAADSALRREKSAHEIAQDRARIALEKVDWLLGHLDNLQRDSDEEAGRCKNKAAQARRQGNAIAYGHARLRIEDLREVIASVLGVKTK